MSSNLDIVKLLKADCVQMILRLDSLEFLLEGSPDDVVPLETETEIEPANEIPSSPAPLPRRLKYTLHYKDEPPKHFATLHEIADHTGRSYAAISRLNTGKIKHTRKEFEYLKDIKITKYNPHEQLANE